MKPRIIIRINGKKEEANIPETWDSEKIELYLNKNYSGWTSWKFAKEEAIELVKKLLPLMYCYSGSGMLSNWYEPKTALTNAIHSCRIIGTPLLPEIEKLTVNDFWTEEELESN